VPEPIVIAKVAITSEPAGAEVYVDGALVGNAPHAITKPQGDKRVSVELRATGYENKALTLSADSQDSIMLTLVKKVVAVEAAPSRPSSHASKPSKPKPEAGKDKPAAGPKGRVQTEVLDPWD
jgi:hypothetical protein